MTESQAGSTVPRRQLGRCLRELRGSAGLTVRAAAKQLERSEPTLWRIESGLVSVRSIEVEMMCRLYGAPEDMTKALMALAKETKAKGWWQTYGDVVPEWWLTTRKKTPKRATTKPRPITARPVRIQASSVRSAAKWTRGSGSALTFLLLPCCCLLVRNGLRR